VLTVRTWTEGELLGLITSGQEENIQLDFKKTIDTTDKAKTELSKDVSAFANTIGGHIIIGMDEDGQATHKAAAITPLDPGAVSKEWLEQVINSRIHPRLSVRIHPVDLLSTALGKVAYVLEIPESGTAHQASDHRYYRRYNFQSVPMEDYEVRQAMNRASRPAYSAWFRPWVMNQGPAGGRALASLRVTVVNVSELTPSQASAVLYLPAHEFALAGEDWAFTDIEGRRYMRREGSLDALPTPGRQTSIDFAQVNFAKQDLPAASVPIHLKVFDDHGLALHEVYELSLSLPSLTHTVVRSDSDRKPANVAP
jgi:schlafen family protein